MLCVTWSGVGFPDGVPCSSQFHAVLAWDDFAQPLPHTHLVGALLCCPGPLLCQPWRAGGAGQSNPLCSSWAPKEDLLCQ